MSCDYNALIAANPCFLELSSKAQQAVIAALLCNISAGTGGGITNPVPALIFADTTNIPLTFGTSPFWQVNVSGTGSVAFQPWDAGASTYRPGVSFVYSGSGPSAKLAIGGGNVLTVRQPGWQAPTGTLSRLSFDQSTVTLPELAQRLAALITDLETHGMIGA